MKNKKILALFFYLLFFAVNIYAANSNEETLKQLGEQGSLIGGTTGLAIVHGVFWVPLALFFVVASVVIGVYYKMFKQKDDGAFKTVAAFAVGIILGVLVYVSSLKLVDKMFNSEGCGGEIVTAYMKDSVKKGLNPGQAFGQTIKGLGCIQ